MVRRAERRVEFRILGPLEVMDGDTAVEVAGTKRRAVLARLLLHANEIVRSERLIDDLWGDQAPRNASAALHNHVCRLRKVLGPELLVRRECGYVLQVDEDAIDLRRFEQLVAAAEPLPARKRSAALGEALRLWRGPALAELDAEPGFRPEITRLDELRIATLERRLDADLEAGRCGELVGEIEALIAEHPWREHLRWQLILALYRAGRQAEALDAYRETRRVLTEELGLEPNPALQELELAILRQDPAIAAAQGDAPHGAVAADPARSRRPALLGMLAVAVLAVGTGSAFVVVRETEPRGTVSGATASGNVSNLATRAATAPASTTQTTTSRAAQPAPPRRSLATQRPASTTATTSQKQRRKHQAEPVTRASRASSAVNPRQKPTVRAHAKARIQKTTRPVEPKHATAAKKPKPVRIADDFDDNTFDGTIWYANRSGAGWSDAVQNGRLEFGFDANAQTGGDYNRVGGHYGTQCKFPGDFDVRVDFALPSWPARNGVGVTLWAFLANRGDGVSRQSTTQWGELYSSWIAGDSSGVQLGDTSGSLRLSRRNGVLRSYFRHKGAWRKLLSDQAPGLVTIAIGADAGPDFAGEPVLVAFDNFVVTAADAVCPPGSDPRDP